MKFFNFLLVVMALLNFGARSVQAKCCIPLESGFCDDGQPPSCPTAVMGTCDQAVHDYVSANIYTKGEYSQNSIFQPFGALPAGFQVEGDFTVSAPAYYTEDPVHNGAYIVEFNYQTQGGQTQQGSASICASLGDSCSVLDQPIGVQPSYGSIGGTVPCN